MSLRELRQKRGFKSSDDFGKRVGMSGGRIREYENGSIPIANMTLGNAIKICDALKIANPRKLLEGESPKENNAD